MKRKKPFLTLEREKNRKQNRCAQDETFFVEITHEFAIDKLKCCGSRAAPQFLTLCDHKHTMSNGTVYTFRAQSRISFLRTFQLIEMYYNHERGKEYIE